MCLTLLFSSDSENPLGPQMPFLPSTEVLVKGLLLITPAAIASSPGASSQILLCSHHPCVIGTNSNAVWKVAIGF